MASVKFENVSKHYGAFSAVKDFNLEINDQEFLVLVGPSGCGKTTSLRMLAGLETISEGKIKIGDRIVNEEPAKTRDIAMVFQSYALYPHWTIYDNLAFGLRMRTLSSTYGMIINGLQLLTYFFIITVYLAFSLLMDLIIGGIGALIFLSGLLGGVVTWAIFPEVRKSIREMNVNVGARFFNPIQEYLVAEKDIEAKVNNTSKLLGIEEQLYKKPRQLSGGQRQRVALGRAIVRDPKVFLMDEPLSNLDAKLRVQMRAELQRLQKKLKTTTIYVTHDQIEAMTLADRIAIMNEGILQQAGPPDEVYTYPINKFVAGFIGSPSMNFIEGKTVSVDGKLHFECDAFTYQIPDHYKQHLEAYVGGDKIWLGVRPEHIKLSEDTSELNKLKAKVGVLEPIGSDTYVYIDFPKALSTTLAVKIESMTLIVKVEGSAPYKLDQEIGVTFHPQNIHFFDVSTGENIILRA